MRIRMNACGKHDVSEDVGRGGPLRVCCASCPPDIPKPESPMKHPIMISAAAAAFLFAMPPALAQERAPHATEGEVSQKSASEAGVEVIDPAPFKALLERYVDARGQVDYARWHASEEGRRRLSQVVESIGQANVEGKSADARLAFYINAYNALVLNAVLERWPVESVMKAEGFFDTAKHRVAGQSLTLDELEHSRVIRAQFNEPRIHFVLVCAAKSCPRLRQDPMRAATLERQLDAAAREFVPAATRRTEAGVETSQLFNWFAEDFVKSAGSVQAYLLRYVRNTELREALEAGAPVSFSEYDWAINAR
ncbi:DUF547 domain-containing protein [Lujinxingia sediminis]|uniref:DUF547 domain-containing protein n=2 Tax=Lujinxingia sediminis TaxID=2480984 RepID=A0ABY0CUW6_9DELT|nr:DUF547 domain-containing protein [Lujinxingia sediminis]